MSPQDKAAASAVPPRGLLVDRDANLRREMRAYLDTLIVTGENIGKIRGSLFVPWDSVWNGWVRDDTAAREGAGVASAAPSVSPDSVSAACEECDLPFQKASWSDLTVCAQCFHIRRLEAKIEELEVSSPSLARLRALTMELQDFLRIIATDGANLVYRKRVALELFDKVATLVDAPPAAPKEP